jgi:hypothetical protein
VEGWFNNEKSLLLQLPAANSDISIDGDFESQVVSGSETSHEVCILILDCEYVKSSKLDRGGITFLRSAEESHKSVIQRILSCKVHDLEEKIVLVNVTPIVSWLNSKEAVSEAKINYQVRVLDQHEVELIFIFVASVPGIEGHFEALGPDCCSKTVCHYIVRDDDVVLLIIPFNIYNFQVTSININFFAAH